MVEILDKLLCLFNVDVRTKGGRHVVGTPRHEAKTGTVEPGETYHVAFISREPNESAESEPNAGPTPIDEPQPSVEVGELRYVEIEDISKQGDGTARVERGYVIIAPGTEAGERVRVEIIEVKSNFAVGKAIEDGF